MSNPDVPSGDGELTRQGLVQRVRVGAYLGFLFAIGLNLFVIALTVLMWSNPFESYGMSFTRGAVMYFAISVPLGAVAGAMAPIARSTLGLLSIGAVCGAMIDIGIEIAMRQHHNLSAMAVFAVLGAGAAPVMRKAGRRGTEFGKEWKRRKFEG